MAQTIKLKRSAVSGNIPNSNQLELGELAVNTTDGRMYFKDGADNIVWVNKTSEVTTTAPTSGAGYPVGYVWYVV
jgi:hypothetical protein